MFIREKKNNGILPHAKSGHYFHISLLVHKHRENSILALKFLTLEKSNGNYSENKTNSTQYIDW